MGRKAEQQAGCAGLGCLGFIVVVFAGMCSTDPPRTHYDTSTTGYHTVEPAPREAKDWLYIHGELNVRSAPRKDAPLVRRLRRGDMVQLGPKDGNGWARVYTGAAGDEYVYRASDLVRSSPPAIAAPAQRASGYGGPSGGTRSSGSTGPRRSSGGRTLHRGPRGGCYYINSNGNKTYVDRSLCN